MEAATVITDAPSAESSPAPVGKAESVVQSLNSEERQTWQRSGELPERVTVKNLDGTVEPAASSSAEPVEQAAPTGASRQPASDPGKPQKGKGAKERNVELDAEISALNERLKLRKALREELASLEPAKSDAKPASSAAQPTALQDWERYAAMPHAPKESDFTTVRDYSAAMSTFVATEMFKEREAATQRTAAIDSHRQRVQATIDGAKGRIEKFREIEPDLESKINPQLVEVVPASLIPPGQGVQAHNALMEEILRSDFTPQLLMHFSTDAGRAEWAQLVTLGSQNPTAFLRAFGRVEARFEASASAGASASPVHHVSSAATPPVVLGTRGAEATDPVEAAIKRKDVRAYMREANKRDLARLSR